MSDGTQALNAIGVALLAICAIGACIAIIIYNGLVRLSRDCDRAWSNIDVLLKQRYDEIPNLVRVCEAYMRYESETLVRVTEARSQGLGAAGMAAADRAGCRATAALAQLFVLSEQYPDLKANEHFLRLQERITGIENEIADRREHFNNCATNYNVRIEQVPDVMVARLFGWRHRRLLKLDTSSEKEGQRAA